MSHLSPLQFTIERRFGANEVTRATNANGGSQGGAMFNTGLTNCTFSNNQANTAGYVYVLGQGIGGTIYDTGTQGRPTIINSILWDQTAVPKSSTTVGRSPLICRTLHHASSQARRAEASSLARERDESLLVTRFTLEDSRNSKRGQYCCAHAQAKAAGWTHAG